MPQNFKVAPSWSEFLRLWKDERNLTGLVSLLKILPRIGDDGQATEDHSPGYPDSPQKFERVKWLAEQINACFDVWAKASEGEFRSHWKEIWLAAFEVAVKYCDDSCLISHRAFVRTDKRGLAALSFLLEQIEQAVEPYRQIRLIDDLFNEQPFRRNVRRLLEICVNEYATGKRDTSLPKSWCYLALISRNCDLVLDHGLYNPAVLESTKKIIATDASRWFRIERQNTLLPPDNPHVISLKTPCQCTLENLAERYISSPPVQIAVLAAITQGHRLSDVLVDIPSWDFPTKE